MDIAPRSTPVRLRIGRALGYWLVPQGIRDAERRLRKAIRAWRLLARHRDLIRPNAELRGRHAGRRCFVIGNGPSLARQDLSPLADEVTFVVNGFWKHPMVERWSPTYYCIMDEVFFDGSDANRHFFSEIRARCPSSTLVLPLDAHRVVAEQDLAPAERVRYVACQGHLRDGLHAPPDLMRVVPTVNNVALFAIMLAMYAGCSPVYLMGLDHDWLAHRGQFGHFFAGPTIENHHTEALLELSRRRYKLLMEGQLDMWNSYESLDAWSRRLGFSILNATDGGFLDVFPRVSYEEIVGATSAPPTVRLRST